jgi:hypothetical protein
MFIVASPAGELMAAWQVYTRVSLQPRQELPISPTSWQRDWTVALAVNWGCV